MNKEISSKRTKDMVYVSLFAVLIAICAWISIPAAVPFTLQTFGIFLAVGVLGGKRGTASVILYILLGAVGLPVFSGFRSGIAALTGPTGGYILGFVASVLLMWGIEKVCGNKKQVRLLSMFLGLFVCYLFGTIWYMVVYSSVKGPVGVGTVLLACVIPFIIPDCIKILLAFFVTDRIKKAVPSL